MSEYHIERDKRDGFYELYEKIDGNGYLVRAFEVKDVPQVIKVLQDALRDHADAPAPTVKDPRQ